MAARLRSFDKPFVGIKIGVSRQHSDFHVPMLS
jgi:hypothetical protein